MNLALLDPFRRQVPDRIDSTLTLPKHFHPQRPLPTSTNNGGSTNGRTSSSNLSKHLLAPGSGTLSPTPTPDRDRDRFTSLSTSTSTPGSTTNPRIHSGYSPGGTFHYNDALLARTQKGPMGKNGIRRVKAARRSKIAALHNIGLPHLNIHGNTKSKKALALALAASQAQAQQAQAQVHQMTPEEEAEWHSCFVVSFNRKGNYIAAGHASGVVPIHDFGSRTLSSIFTSPMRSESVRILQEKDGEDICVEKMELKLHQKKKDELEEGKDADADADMEEKSKGHKSSDEGSSDDEVDMERERQRKREQKKRSSYFDTEIADDHKTSEEKSSPSASSSSSAPPSRLFQNGITSISWSRQSKKMMIGSYKDNLLCIVDNTHPYGPEDVYFGITGKKDKGSGAGSGAGNASTKDKEKRCVSPVPVEKDGEGSPSAAAENPTGASGEKVSARARARSRAESAVDTPATASASAATNTNIAYIISPMGTRNQRSSSTVMMTNGGDEKQSHLNDLNWLPKSSLLQPKTGDKPKHKNLKPKSNNNDDDDNDGDADSNNSNDKTDNKANTNTNAEGVELTAEELTILSKQPPFSYEEKYILQMLSNRMEEAGCTIEQAYEATKKKIVQTTRCQTLVMPLPQGIGLCAQLHPSGNGGLACLEDGSLLLFHTPTSAFENCVYADPDVTSEMEGRKSRVMGNYVYLSMPIASIPKIHRDGNSGGGDGGGDGDGDGDGNKDGEKNTTNTHRHGPTTPYHVVCARFDTMGDAVFATTKCGKLVVYELDEQLKKALFHNAPTADPDEEEPSKYFKFKTKSQTYMKISGSGSGSAVAPHQIALSQNGQMLLLNCKDGVLRLYETSALLVAEKLTMEKTPGKGWIRQIDVSPRLMFQDIVSKSRWASCDFSGDGEYVVGGCNNEDSGSGDKYELYFWNTTTGVLIDQLTGPQIHLYSISWHPTRSFIAVGTSDGLVDLWGPRLDWQNFAPDFQSLQNNVEYVEKEDEFDTIVDGDHDEEAKRKELADRIEEEAIVDIITIDEDSDGEDEAFFFQTKLQSMRSNFL